MKKIILIAALLATSTAFAQHHGHYGHRHHGHGARWVPWIGGAIAGAVIYDIYNRPVIVQQPPVVVQQPPVVQQYPQYSQQCSPWTETQNSDGTITRTRTCTQ
jgi:hypothetical protein